jgi:probable F420-dependent oxidoreductase
VGATNGIRFGLHFWDLPTASWVDRVRRYERLGFSSITFTDHQIVPQWEPIAALAAVAAATNSIRLGTLVLDMGLRNPVLTAKAAATLDVLSSGRLELGLGAGYVAQNFVASGVPFERAGDRIARLEESLLLMRRLWAETSTTMHGRFFDVVDAPMVLREAVTPTVLIGGGGPKMMNLGGRAADIVSMIPRQETGEWSVKASLADSTIERMAQKARWVRESAEKAGRDPSHVELHTMVVRTIVGDEVDGAIAQESADTDVPVASMGDSSLYLTGSGPQIRDRLRNWQAHTGLSYISIFDPGDDQVEYLAKEVVAPLRAA